MLIFFTSRRRHTILQGDWSSDVCSSDLRKMPPISIVTLRRSRTSGSRKEVNRSVRIKAGVLAVGDGRLSDSESHHRSEERRVGKEDRCQRVVNNEKKKRDSSLKYQDENT